MGMEANPLNPANILDTTAEVMDPNGDGMVTVDLANPPEWLDIDKLQAEAVEHGDHDLVSTIDAIRSAQ